MKRGRLFLEIIEEQDVVGEVGTAVAVHIVVRPVGVGISEGGGRKGNRTPRKPCLVWLLCPANAVPLSA
jgi:hypothetical protein